MNAVLPAVSVLISMPEPTERTQSTPNLGGLSLGPDQLLDAENAKRKSETTDSESSLDQSIGSICCSSADDCAASNAGSTAQIFTVEVALPPELVVKKEEGKLQFLLQTCIPFVLAGLGMVGAGMLFDHWSQGLFLTKVPEAITLIPALSGLKGNLEMTLASRLSTMAHLGQIDGRKQKVRAFYSNLAVDQAQAIVVSLFASLFAIAIQLGQGKSVEPSNALCLMLASTLTATVTSLVLATLMLTLTFAARSLRLNPDNISTPIAAALGDLTSLASLIFFGTHLYPVRQTMAPWLIAALALLLYSSLVWMWVASREKSTRKVLKFGWFAVLAAMCLSSVGGSVLKDAVQQFQRIGLFQPLINGVGGNLVAVQSSKISTHLFSSAKYGQLPANRLLTYLNPLRTFRGKERESLNALILLALALPGHLLFLGLILAINGGQLGQEGLMGPTFVLLYLGAALTQVALLLYICQLLCRVLWICGLNPDLNSIPLLTAMGDLFGSILLAGAFLVHSLVMQK